jgi:hypothetical protein
MDLPRTGGSVPLQSRTRLTSPTSTEWKARRNRNTTSHRLWYNQIVMILLECYLLDRCRRSIPPCFQPINNDASPTIMKTADVLNVPYPKDKCATPPNTPTSANAKPVVIF